MVGSTNGKRLLVGDGMGVFVGGVVAVGTGTAVGGSCWAQAVNSIVITIMRRICVYCCMVV